VDYTRSDPSITDYVLELPTFQKVVGFDRSASFVRTEKIGCDMPNIDREGRTIASIASPATRCVKNALLAASHNKDIYESVLGLRAA
jgi:hypothetical protein